jgi:hypothetical protein
MMMRETEGYNYVADRDLIIKGDCDADTINTIVASSALIIGVMYALGFEIILPIFPNAVSKNINY